MPWFAMALARTSTTPMLIRWIDSTKSHLEYRLSPTGRTFDTLLGPSLAER